MRLDLEELASGAARVALAGGAAVLQLARPTVGQVSLETGDADGTTVSAAELAAALTVDLRGSALRVHSERIAVAALELGAGRLTLGRLAGPVSLRPAGGELTLTAEVACGGVDLQWDVGAQLGPLTLSSVRLARGPLTLTMEQLSLPEGLVVAGGAVEIPALELRGASLELDPLRLGGGGGPGPDLGFLDALHGQLDVDLMLDLTAPVLGRRRATHPMRLAIVDGTIDYRELEDSLSLLEDTVIDFELEGETLILEKDLPLVPFDNTTLVTWQLDEPEQELARQGRVRLRRLLDYALPDRAGDTPPAVSVELHRLELSSIDVALGVEELVEIALGGAGQIQLGGDERPGVVELRARGELRHDAAEPALPSEIIVSVKEVNGQLPGLQLHGLEVAAHSFHLGAVEGARLTFAGLQPRRLELPLGAARARGIRLAW